MTTRYNDAQTVGQEHGKGAESLRTWSHPFWQASSPAGCETITHGPWRAEVDARLREVTVNVSGQQPDANADLTVYVYRNQQRLTLTGAAALDNAGGNACDPTPRVPFVLDVTGRLGDGACGESTPQMLSFLQPNLTCCATVTVRVNFSTPVWNCACEGACADLVAGDFTFVDTSCGGVTICSVAHNAGDNFATLTMSGGVVSTINACGDYDLVSLADTLSPACGAIFGPMNGACVPGLAAAVNTQPISGDTARAVFPYGPEVIMKGDMVYGETLRDTCSTLVGAWSLEIGWMPDIFGSGTDYKTYVG
jgi:hypothetical protein